MLHDQQQSLDASLLIPVRLIATENDEVIASIIKATNRQTEVREDQLLALSDFQKKLEDYFKSYENGHKLYYERRSRQYNDDASMAKTRVVTMANLIRAYSSMFRRQPLPHRTTRGYSDLLDGIGKEIFGPDDRLEPYYIAAYALYRLETLFRTKSLDPKYKPARYHALLAFRILANPVDPPAANSHALKRYCDDVVTKLWDSSQAEAIFREAAASVDAVAAGNFHRDNIRTLAFTTKLIEHCKRKARV